MDVSNEYIEAVVKSTLLQELWRPRMLHLVSDRSNSNLYWIGQKIYNKYNGDLSEIKENVLWVPQGGEIFHSICIYKDADYEKMETSERAEFSTKVMNEMYSILRVERTRYVNWDILFKSREKRELYYFLKYIEGKDFPRISLLSIN